MTLIRKKASSRLAASNRLNSLRSTGPRSLQGKTQSSRNAIKYGIHASILLANLKATGQAPAELEEIHSALSLGLEPGDSFEQILVEDMAIIRWRMLRLCSAEGEAWHRHRIGTIKKHAAALDSQETVSSESGEISENESFLKAAKEAYSWITEDPNKYGSLSEPSTRDAALLILSLALWQFRNDFMGFEEIGLQKLRTLYGLNPGVGGNTVLARYEECLKQDLADETSRRVSQEQFLEDLDKEINYYFRLTNFVAECCASECKKVTSTFRGREGRARDFSNDHLQAALRQREDEVMPGEVLDRIIRYESHLERQFERKLQQLVAWRRAKGEPLRPVSMDDEDRARHKAHD